MPEDRGGAAPVAPSGRAWTCTGRSRPRASDGYRAQADHPSPGAQDRTRTSPSSSATWMVPCRSVRHTDAPAATSRCRTDGCGWP